MSAFERAFRAEMEAQVRDCGLTPEEFEQKLAAATDAHALDALSWEMAFRRADQERERGYGLPMT